MAVKVVITLDGVEEVKKGLNDVTKAGTQSAQAISQLNTQEVNQALNNLGLVSKTTATNITGLTIEAKNLRQAKLALRPVVQALGGSLGILGSALTTSRLGFEAFGAVAGVALILSLTKLSETIEKTKSQIQGLGSGPSQGKAFFDAAAKSAENLGVRLQTIAPAVTEFQIALNKIQGTKIQFIGDIPPALSQQIEKNRQAFESLFKTLQIGGAGFTEVSTALAKFFQEAGNTGQITGKMVEGLRNVSSEGVQLLGKLFGKSNIEAWITELDQTPLSFNRLISTINQNKDVINKAFETANIKSLENSVDGVIAAVDRLAQSVTGKTFAAAVISGVDQITQGINTTKQELDALKTALSNLAPENPNLPTQAFSLEQFTTQLVGDAQRAFDSVVQVATSAFQSISQIFSTPFDLSAITSSFASFWQSVVQLAQQAANRIQQIINSLVSIGDLAGGFGGFGVPFASGGHVRGPGTGTSDSILAWLSNNEFVMRDAAVRHYGLGFMQAINSLRLPKDFFRGFNMGGLVTMPSMPVPRFASGGLATSTAGRSLTLVLDGKSFGLNGSKTTIDELERASILRQAARIGATPNWVRK